MQQNNEGEMQRDPSRDTSDVQKEHNGKKRRTEQLESSDSRGKQTKDDSDSKEPAKENYIHVRARRGQATNSHSLAERVKHIHYCSSKCKIYLKSWYFALYDEIAATFR